MVLLGIIVLKKIIYYILWSIILIYLAHDFIKTNPLGRDSAFSNATCHEKKINLNKIFNFGL